MYKHFSWKFELKQKVESKIKGDPMYIQSNLSNILCITCTSLSQKQKKIRMLTYNYDIEEMFASKTFFIIHNFVLSRWQRIVPRSSRLLMNKFNFTQIKLKITSPFTPTKACFLIKQRQKWPLAVNVMYWLQQNKSIH